MNLGRNVAQVRLVVYLSRSKKPQITFITRHRFDESDLPQLPWNYGLWPDNRSYTITRS